MAQADVRDRAPARNQDSAKPATWAAALKWVLIVAVVALAGVIVQRLLTQGLWLAVVGVAFVAMAILAVYGTRRAVPLKYLMPGLLLLLALQVWPIVYTVGTAFTNFGDGHRISKQESVDSIIANSVQEVPGTSRYKLTVAVKRGRRHRDRAAGVPAHRRPRARRLRRRRQGAGGPDRRRRARRRPLGKVTAAPGYTILNARQVNARKDLGHVRGADAGRRRHQARSA